MSGIYIPGLAMPTNCLDCPVYWDKCPVWDTEGDEYLERIHPDCPLIPVPDHGRLIDADALMKKGMPLSFSVQKWVQEVDIACAPTIIPADPLVMYYPQVDGITPTIIEAEEEQT